VPNTPTDNQVGTFSNLKLNVNSNSELSSFISAFLRVPSSAAEKKSLPFVAKRPTVDT